MPSPVRALAVAALAGAGCIAGGCATVVEGTSQDVRVLTTPVEQADCTLTSPAIGTVNLRTPGVARIPKSRHNVSVTCRKEGYEDGSGTIGVHFAAATVGNIIIGGLVGAAIDASSGAANKYDPVVTVVLRERPGAAAERAGDKTARRERRPAQTPAPAQPAATPAVERRPLPTPADLGQRLPGMEHRAPYKQEQLGLTGAVLPFGRSDFDTIIRFKPGGLVELVAQPLTISGAHSTGVGDEGTWAISGGQVCVAFRRIAQGQTECYAVAFDEGGGATLAGPGFLGGKRFSR